MRVEWIEEAWSQFQKLLQDGQIKDCKKIAKLIDDIQKNGAEKGIGKPERLKHELNELYSREINTKDRLVYKIDGDMLIILQCNSHYENVK